MGEVVNLRQERKRRMRAAARTEAAASRAAHGRTKGEIAATTRETERQEKAVDGARLEERNKQET